jgi:hypothetical protein
MPSTDGFLNERKCPLSFARFGQLRRTPDSLGRAQERARTTASIGYTGAAVHHVTQCRSSPTPGTGMDLECSEGVDRPRYRYNVHLHATRGHVLVIDEEQFLPAILVEVT